MELMKRYSLVFVFFLFTSIFIFNNCDAVTEKNDECEESNWAQVKEPILYMYIGLEDSYCDPPANLHHVPHATQMTFSGKITKIYCDGTVSSSFDINTTFYPSQMSLIELGMIKVGQAYQFKFQNDKDYLLFAGRLTGIFSDGKKYESEELTARVYFKNILYNANSMEYYDRLLTPSTTKWFMIN